MEVIKSNGKLSHGKFGGENGSLLSKGNCPGTNEKSPGTNENVWCNNRKIAQNKS
jgi:hypothetical protein